MKIVFMGTPDFSVPSLESICGSNHEIVAIVTQPDKGSGRGKKKSAPAAKSCAERNSVPVLQPKSLRNTDFLDELRAFEPDLFAVVAFSMLPKEMLSIPKWGAINLHASLLPKYRGAAPIQWAIANGETETGATIFKIEEKMDTGNILSQRRTPIGPDERADEVHDRLMIIGAELLLTSINSIADGSVELRVQDDSLACPAPKLKKEDGLIDWKMSAERISNRIRGFYPYPGSFTFLKGKQRVCISRGRPAASDVGQMSPGQVVECAENLVVASGSGALEVLEIQPEYKKVMKAKEFLKGYREIKMGYPLG